MKGKMTSMAIMSSSKIGKLQEMFGVALRKAEGLFDLEAQEIIENDWKELEPELEAACISAIAKVRERKRYTIVRFVRNIRRHRTAQQAIDEAIDATGWKPYLDTAVVAGMPVGAGPEETELVYFYLGRYICAYDLAKEYELRGLVPDPQAQAADNESDPTFADEHPNGVQWKDIDGDLCCAAWDHWGGGQGVYIDRPGLDWRAHWWFGGRRK